MANIVTLTFNGGVHQVHPLYGDNVEATKERVSGQMYYRTQINGSFSFIGEDYDLIHSQSLDTEFSLSISKDSLFFGSALFYKTDCTFDTIHKKCEVRLSLSDNYNKILKGIDHEYDLVQLAPEREEVEYSKRGILQFAVAGDTKVTNIIGGSSYEADLSEEVVVGTHCFNDVIRFDRITFTSKSYLPNTYDGEYVNSDETLNEYVRTDGEYFIRRTFSQARYYIYDKVGNIQRYGGLNEPITIDNFVHTNNVVTARAYYVDSLRTEDYMDGSGLSFRVLGRILTDKADAEGAVRRTDDIYDGTLNYRYVCPISSTQSLLENVKNGIFSSILKQVEPTPYMKDEDGLYFVKPSPRNSTDNNVIPIGWNMWIPNSFWFECDNTIFNVLDSEDYYAVPVVLRDAYPLEMAIKVLLGRIDEDVDWCGTLPLKEYSNFLFEGNSYFNPILDMDFRMFITPITNIKNAYYSNPAQQGKITLGQILDMLKGAFQAYWFIEERNGRKIFRIEHISWFANREEILDLTDMIAPRNFKTWGYNQSTYAFDRDSLPNRYEFGWQENGIKEFNGYPLKVEDKYVSESNTYEAKISNFFPDLDMILSHPESVSNDCFALLGTADDNIVWMRNVQVQTSEGNSPIFKLQNGYLSFLSLALFCYRYDMPAEHIRIEDMNLPLVPTSLKKARTMGSITFPYNSADFNGKAYGTIITPLGVAEIKKITLNLSSMMAKADLILTTNDTQ